MYRLQNCSSRIQKIVPCIASPPFLFLAIGYLTIRFLFVDVPPFLLAVAAAVRFLVVPLRFPLK
jgi:hypothetical protein